MSSDFHLRARSEFYFTLRADGEIYIRSQRALLHPTVRNAGKAHQLAQLFEIFDRLLGASHIRLADYLKQRHSAAVAVDERAVVVGECMSFPASSSMCISFMRIILPLSSVTEPFRHSGRYNWDI